MSLLKRLPLLTALLGFIAAFVWLDNDKQFRRDVYEHYSLHNLSDKGCSLSFRYLKASRQNGAFGVELNRLVDHATLDPHAVLFRVGPQIVPGEHPDDEAKTMAKLKVPIVKKADPARPLLTPGEKSWVENGGRLVLALDHVYGPLESLPIPKSGTLKKVFPAWPGVEKISPANQRFLQGVTLNNAHTLIALNGEPFAAQLPLGAGDVILLASPEIFSNEFLDRDDHLRLLEALALPARPVYFDEFVHGLHGAPGMLELLTRWGLGAAMLVFALASVFAFWRARVPVGPPEDDHRETRTQAIDFVGSLAPLYDRALDKRQALALHYRNFIQTVSAQSGLRGESLARKIRELLSGADEAALAGKRELSGREFAVLLHSLNEAYGRLERAHRR